MRIFLTGANGFIGRGLNGWSNCHLADVASLYALVLAKGTPGSFLHVESGEETLGDVVHAIGARLGMETKSSH